MVSLLTACTQSIQMVVNQYECCVTWPRTVEAGPFFRDVWTALLTSFVTGNLAKRGSEVWAASSGSEMTIFTVWRMLMTSCWELTWRTLRGTSHSPSTRHLRLQTRLISTDSLSENTVAPREIPSCIIGIVNSQEIHGCWMCFVHSLSWAESMVNQKRFLNLVLSSLLIFFKLKVKLPLRLTAIGIVEVIGQNVYCSRDIYLQWRKDYRSDTVFLEMRTKFKRLLRTDYSESESGNFSEMSIAVLRLSGDESLVFWGPISWSSLWTLIWYKWLKSLELASWIFPQIDCTKTAGHISESLERQFRVCSFVWYIALIVILIISPGVKKHCGRTEFGDDIEKKKIRENWSENHKE